MSTREREEADVDGNWPKSGIESQKMIRLFVLELTATQTLEERDSEPADNGVDTFPIRDVGRGENDAWPE
jgi:hypothetical protein